MSEKKTPRTTIVEKRGGVSNSTKDVASVTRTGNFSRVTSEQKPPSRPKK